VIVQLITDKKIIKDLLLTKGIADQIEYKGDDIPIRDDFVYIAGYEDSGKLFGICIYEPFRDSVELHMNIIPGFRQQNAKEFGKRCLAAGPEVIYAQIPDRNNNVLKYAQSFGFEIIESKDGHNVLRFENGIR